MMNSQFIKALKNRQLITQALMRIVPEKEIPELLAKVGEVCREICLFQNGPEDLSIGPDSDTEEDMVSLARQLYTFLGIDFWKFSLLFENDFTEADNPDTPIHRYMSKAVKKIGNMFLSVTPSEIVQILNSQGYESLVLNELSGCMSIQYLHFSNNKMFFFPSI